MTLAEATQSFASLLSGALAGFPRREIVVDRVEAAGYDVHARTDSAWLAALANQAAQQMRELAPGAVLNSVPLAPPPGYPRDRVVEVVVDGFALRGIMSLDVGRVSALPGDAGMFRFDFTYREAR